MLIIYLLDRIVSDIMETIYLDRIFNWLKSYSKKQQTFFTTFIDFISIIRLYRII